MRNKLEYFYESVWKKNNSNSNSTSCYSSFQRRLLAALADFFVIYLFFHFLYPTILFISASYVYPTYPEDMAYLIDYFSDLSVPNEGESITLSDLHSMLIMDGIYDIALKYTIFSFLLQYFFIASYVISFWIAYGATPGKMLLSIKILDLNGNQPHPIKFFVRFFLYPFSIVPLYIGYLPIMFDKKKRSLHDLIAGTVVYYGNDQTQNIDNDEMSEKKNSESRYFRYR